MASITSSMMRSFSRLATSELIIDGTPRALSQFIETGPLFERCFKNSNVNMDVEKWQSHGSLLTQTILKKKTTEGFSLAEAVRIYQYYLPIYFWVESLMKAQENGAPLVVGLSCPQGGGKTTLVDALNLLFTDDGQVRERVYVCVGGGGLVRL
jgi:hypothetical protein